MTSSVARWLAVFLAGLCGGAAAHALLFSHAQTVHAQVAQHVPDLQALSDRVKTIEGKLPSQSHTMQDVSYHFGNLWFAGQHENWDLAEFYWLETVSHLRWAVRVIPIRKDNAGNDVNLREILTGFENGPLDQLHRAVQSHDSSAFDIRYRECLETCYSCHKAADKPYLRPQIPTEPESPIVNFDPHADWPK